MKVNIMKWHEIKYHRKAVADDSTRFKLSTALRCLNEFLRRWQDALRWSQFIDFSLFRIRGDSSNISHFNRLVIDVVCVRATLSSSYWQLIESHTRLKYVHKLIIITIHDICYNLSMTINRWLKICITTSIKCVHNGRFYWMRRLHRLSQ